MSPNRNVLQGEAEEYEPRIARVQCRVASQEGQVLSSNNGPEGERKCLRSLEIRGKDNAD